MVRNIIFKSLKYVSKALERGFKALEGKYRIRRKNKRRLIVVMPYIKKVPKHFGTPLLHTDE